MTDVKEYQPFSEIPSSILREILARVPIETCLTCKVVCKEWYHIIIAQDFSSFRRHCNASRFTLLFNNTRNGLVFDLVEMDKSLDINDSGKCTMGAYHLTRVEPKIDTSYGVITCCVISQCNGAVCFANGRGDFFVCHLLTSQCVKLQNLHQLRNGFHLSGFELGCCPVSGQFKFLFLLWDVSKKVQLAKIQTLGDGEWRSIGNTPLKIMMDGCFLHGSTHWLDQTYIWSFHFGEEKFLQVPYPNDVITEPYKKKNKELSVFDSCLCLSCFSEGFSGEIDIWVMKEYGMRESWVKQFVVVSDEWCVPLVQMHEGKILLRSEYRLCLYDPQTQVFKTVKLEFDGRSTPMLPAMAFDASFSRF